MRVAYFDCFSGISGDMALGALVHAGADLAAISETIGSLPVDEFVTEAEEVEVHAAEAPRAERLETDAIWTHDDGIGTAIGGPDRAGAEEPEEVHT